MTVAIDAALPGKFSFFENAQEGEPRTGAFEVVLKRGAGQALKDTLLWSKLQVGEPSSDDPETLKAISEAIVMELKSELNKN